jgi:hypothetical protein
MSGVISVVLTIAGRLGSSGDKTAAVNMDDADDSDTDDGEEDGARRDVRMAVGGADLAMREEQLRVLEEAHALYVHRHFYS